MANDVSGAKADKAAAVPESGWPHVAREAIAAAVSLAILSVAMWAFVSTFSAAGSTFVGDAATAMKEAYERQKDLLSIATGLLGTVMGYYFGRVPAELRAQAAQGQLGEASAEAGRAREDSALVKRNARAAADAALSALKALESADPHVFAGLTAGVKSADSGKRGTALDEALAQLAALRNL